MKKKILFVGTLDDLAKIIDEGQTKEGYVVDQSLIGLFL